MFEKVLLSFKSFYYFFVCVLAWIQQGSKPVCVGLCRLILFYISFWVASKVNSRLTGSLPSSTQLACFALLSSKPLFCLFVLSAISPWSEAPRIHRAAWLVLRGVARHPHRRSPVRLQPRPPWTAAQQQMFLRIQNSRSGHRTEKRVAAAAPWRRVRSWIWISSSGRGFMYPSPGRRKRMTSLPWRGLSYPTGPRRGPRTSKKPSRSNILLFLHQSIHPSIISYITNVWDYSLSFIRIVFFFCMAYYLFLSWSTETI